MSVAVGDKVSRQLSSVKQQPPTPSHRQCRVSHLENFPSHPLLLDESESYHSKVINWNLLPGDGGKVFVLAFAFVSKSRQLKLTLPRPSSANIYFSRRAECCSRTSRDDYFLLKTSTDRGTIQPQNFHLIWDEKTFFAAAPSIGDNIFAWICRRASISRPGVILIDSGPTRHQMNAQKDLFCNQMKLERNRGWFEFSIISFSVSLLCREPTFRQLFSVAAWAKSARFHSWSEKKAHTRGKKVSIYVISYQSRELFRAWTRGKKFYIIKCIFVRADILMSGIIFLRFYSGWSLSEGWPMVGADG